MTYNFMHYYNEVNEISVFKECCRNMSTNKTLNESSQCIYGRLPYILVYITSGHIG